MTDTRCPACGREPEYSPNIPNECRCPNKECACCFWFDLGLWASLDRTVLRQRDALDQKIIGLQHLYDEMSRLAGIYAAETMDLKCLLAQIGGEK